MAIRVGRFGDRSTVGLGVLETGKNILIDRPVSPASCQDHSNILASNNGGNGKTFSGDSAFQQRTASCHQFIAEHVLDVIWTMDLEGRFTYISPSVRDIRGWTPEELMNMPLERQLMPESMKVLSAHLLRAKNDISAGRQVRIEAQVEEYCKDGSTVWMEIKAAYAVDRFGRYCELVGISRDITKEKQLRAEPSIVAQQDLLLAEEIRQATWTMQLDGEISFVSPSIQKLCGITPIEFMQLGLAKIHPSESLQRFQGYLKKVSSFRNKLNSSATYRGELEYICKDGSVVWADVVAIPILNGNGEIKHLLGASRDITERKIYEEQLHLAIQRLSDFAIKDSLTGIWNRRHLESVVSDAVANSERYGDTLTLVLCDIDCFKSINDSYGHLVGDQVLVEFTQRISSHLRDGDSFGRWGGEEFLVLLPRGDYKDATSLAEKLRHCIADTHFLGVGKVTASFGVVQRNLHESALDWFRRVDEQLYNAKRSGRNCVMSASDSSRH